MARTVVSVIVPYHNEGAEVHRALESLRRQEFAGNFEILLVDDASQLPADSVVSESDELRIIRTDVNLHAAGARNLGIREARGDLICFLDADDEYLPCKLAVESRFLLQHPEVAMVGSRGFIQSIEGFQEEYIPRHVNNRYKRRINDSFVLPFDQVRQEITIHYPFHTNGMMIKREALLAVGGFHSDWRWAAEWDLQVRLAQKFPMAYVPHPTFRYLRREASITSTVNPHKELSGARMFSSWLRNVTSLSSFWRGHLKQRIRESYLLASQRFLEVRHDPELALHCALSSLKYGTTVWGMRSSIRCLLHHRVPRIAQRLNPLSIQPSSDRNVSIPEVACEYSESPETSDHSSPSLAGCRWTPAGAGQIALEAHAPATASDADDSNL